MNRSATSLLVPLLVVMASCSSTPVSPPSPATGALTGIVTARDQDGSHAAPVSGALVGVYDQVVRIGGPIQEQQPQPVATARTDASGLFRIRGLAAGRWFVVVTQGGFGQGRWVSFDPAVGASVALSVCRDCPVPMRAGATAGAPGTSGFG